MRKLRKRRSYKTGTSRNPKGKGRRIKSYGSKRGGIRL